MAHDHHHDEGSYYVEQLCTIGVCGAMGGVAVVLWYRDKLSFLHPNFRLPLLLGGIALLVLVAIRILVVWSESGKRIAHNHNHDHDHPHEHGPNCDHHHHPHEHKHDHHHHEHGPECQHDHHHPTHAHEPAAQAATHVHTHDHGHDHSHGWGPWRFAVLLFPIMLFFLNLPNEGFAHVSLAHLNTAGLGSVEGVADKGKLGYELTFKELEGVAYNPDRRAAYEGKTVDLKGQFVPTGDPRVFRLVRLKINCCAADAIPLNAIIIVEPKNPDSKEKLPSEALQMKWVRVTGQIQFKSRPQGKDLEWLTLIVVRPDEETPLKDLVTEIPPNERPPAYEY